MGGRKPPGGDCRLRDHTAPARAHQPTNATGPRKHGSQAAASWVTLAPAANVRTARRNGQTAGSHGEYRKATRPLFSNGSDVRHDASSGEHGRGSSASPAATTPLPASKRSGPRCHPRAAPDHHVCRLVPGGEHREALTTGLSVLREALVDKPIGCRPMCTTQEANPIVIAVAVGRGLARFWCDHCKCWHQHGRVSKHIHNNNRISHCWSSKSPQSPQSPRGVRAPKDDDRIVYDRDGRAIGTVSEFVFYELSGLFRLRRINRSEGRVMEGEYRGAGRFISSA